MASPPLAQQDVRQKLRQARDTVLALHKALLDSERTSYEMSRGPIGSPAAFLQLLINDPWFAWLQPITTLIVQVDEALAAKNPPTEDGMLQQLLIDMKALFSAPLEGADAEDNFRKRYLAAFQRDPAVRVLHERVERELG